MIKKLIDLTLRYSAAILIMPVVMIALFLQYCGNLGTWMIDKTSDAPYRFNNFLFRILK